MTEQKTHKHLVTNFKLTCDPLQIAIAYNHADSPENGAVVLMSGMVRNQTGGRTVAYLDYQGYDEMALKIFDQIAIALQGKYPEIKSVVIHHRLGHLQIGEISVLVAVGSPHRAAAFSACSEAIDLLKQNAPIWKKEYWRDGESSWVNLAMS
jgi:molybdopterin synthase catalytic subunit